jgi:hypothetical protein
VLALAAIATGTALHLSAHPDGGDAVWAGLIAVVLVPLSWVVARDVMRGRFGVDVIALVSMAGALALGEQLAGAVVALMLAGGNALEAATARVFGRSRRLAPILRTSMAYPLAARFRSGITLAMFTLVVFTLVTGTATSGSFVKAFKNLDTFGGGFDVRASSSPSARSTTCVP